MLQFSFPVGRFFGVHVRAHLSLALLLALAMGYSATVTGTVLRGFALWLALLAALLTRELTRAVAAAYFDLPLRALFLLPVGGIMALAPPAAPLTPSRTRLMTFLGSGANFLVALLLLGLAYGIDPRVQLVAQPWITVSHLLRSTVWLQVLIGLVNLVLTGAPSRARQASSTADPAQPVALLGLWGATALAMMLAGALAGLLSPILLGMAILVFLYARRSTGKPARAGLALSVREVMLTEYKPLSASSTLRDALRQTSQSAQELFPVLRGERLVGWVSRAAIAGRLRVEGDGFLQGTMTRAFQTVAPSEKVAEALQRARSLGAGEFIPVVDQGAMIGLLTPVGLERAVGQLALTRVPMESDAR